MLENKFELPTEILLRAIVAKNLKKLRKNHGLTQEALAKLTGINRVTIAKYENCAMCPSLNNLLVIIKVLDETPNTILEGWEELYK